MIQFKRSSAEGGRESSALTAYQSANQQGQQRLHSAFALFTLHTSNECDLCLSLPLALSHSNTLSISALPGQTNLFILMSSNPDLQQKQTFLFSVGAPVICFHLQTGAAVNVYACKHTTRRPFYSSRTSQWEFSDAVAFCG